MNAQSHPDRPPDEARESTAERALPLLIAVVLHGIMLGTVLQAWLSDWPQRDWLTAGAGVMVVLTLIVGKPATVGAVAFSILFVLLSYYLGLDANGLRIASIPFDQAAAALFLLSLVVAVWCLTRVQVLPRPTRFLMAALGIYAALPVALGLIDGTPFQHVLAGPEGVRSWLQGGFVGSQVLLPLGALGAAAALANAVLRRNRRAMHAAAGSLLILSTAVSLVSFELHRQGLPSLATVILVAKLPQGDPSPLPPGAPYAPGLPADVAAEATLATQVPAKGEPLRREPFPARLPSSGLGIVEAVLAKGVTKTYDPVSATTQFTDEIEKIYLVLKANLSTDETVDARWVVVSAQDYDPDDVVAEQSLNASRDGLRRGVMWAHAPEGGFPPGDYRVDVSIDLNVVKSLPFKIVPLFPAAGPVDPQGPPRGLNIALAALGGKVESVSSEYEPGNAARLIDGAALSVSNGEESCGWDSQLDDQLPQDLVFSFHQGREALISGVTLDFTMQSCGFDDPSEHPEGMPRDIEVWTASGNAPQDFSRIGGARLPHLAGEHLITLRPTQARYVKLRVLSRHGSYHTRIGEVRIIEAAESATSVVADVAKNLALPALGGVVARFTSQASFHEAAHLVDGSVATNGWASAGEQLPQDIVFAFRNDQTALIDTIVLNPRTPELDSSMWARTFSVAVSTENPLDGFEEVGRFTLTPDPTDQSFVINRRARFVRVRFIDHHGEPIGVGVGEIKLIEGRAPGYESVLLTDADTASAVARTYPAGLPLAPGEATETEPNDTAAEPNPLMLGRPLQGTIQPLGEMDHFNLALAGPGAGMVTLELIGEPNVRSSLSLLDEGGRVLKHFDPGRFPRQRATFSWAITPGEHVLRVTEPPTTIVLVWDTSGSMEGSLDDLRTAVEGYLNQVRPTERLNLIRFSEDVEVLLDEFSSDRARLQASARGKFEAGEGTALNDALAKAIELLAGVQGNRAIVLMTDGADTASQLGHNELWRLLEENRIRVYTIGLGVSQRNYLNGIASSGERMLGHVALATNGRFFFARTSDDLRGVYEQIAAELRRVSSYRLTARMSPGSGQLIVQNTGERITGISAPARMELILDASGSMLEKDKGQRKVDRAKAVLARIIKDLPDDMTVGLRVFGHTIRENDPGDCEDSELLVPFDRIDKPGLLREVNGIAALGTTPIAYSLQQVESDLEDTEGKKLVILVTDGKEECGGKPSEVARALVQKGLEVRVEVVAYDIADAATKEELARVAAVTGGAVHQAEDAASLEQALRDALATRYEVLDAAGEKVAQGPMHGPPANVPEGVYTVVVQSAEDLTIRDVRIAHDQLTTVELKKEGQAVGVQVRGPVLEQDSSLAARQRPGAAPQVQ